MIDELKTVREDFISESRSIQPAKAALEQFHAKYLGRKGAITRFTDRLKNLPREERPAFGQELNRVKRFMEEEFERMKSALETTDEPAGDTDITLPPRAEFRGHSHPLSLIEKEIRSIFGRLGFTAEDGPEVELDYYNFETVNIPKNHPARDMQDTFFISDSVVLRTHTTPVQARVMESRRPPIRIICPGRVYRKDTPDATHLPCFHQVEGLVVDTGVHFGDLKGTIGFFIHQMFGQDIAARFRPSYFSFTEPSAEVDMSCIFCKGKGCRTCKNSGWIEIMGAGMVNPKLFEYAGYEPDRYTGYAFGMGIERIAMLVYGVNDLRLFIENDLRFLNQFA